MDIMLRSALTRALGWELDNELGEGSRGTVFRVGGDAVAKISNNDGDYLVAKAILGESRVPVVLPEIYEAKAISLPAFGKYWCVLREDLPDLPKKELEGIDWAAIYAVVRNAISKIFDEYYPPTFYKASLKTPPFRTLFPGEPYPNDKTIAVFEHLRDPLLWLYERGLFVDDVSNYNLGYRANGLVVIRDFSETGYFDDHPSTTKPRPESWYKSKSNGSRSKK